MTTKSEQIVYAKTQTQVLEPGTATGSVFDIGAEHGIRCFDIGFEYEGDTTIELMDAGGDLDDPDCIHGGSAAKIALSWYVVSNGGTTPPEHAALYKACGFTQTTNLTAGEEGIEFRQTSNPKPLLYLTLNQGNYKRSLVNGMAADFNIKAEANGALMCTASFVGNLVGNLDEPRDDNLPFPDYPEGNPIVVMNGRGGTIDEIGGSAQIPNDSESIEIDSGINTSVNKNVSAHQGYSPPVMTKRGYKIKLNPIFNGEPYMKWKAENKRFAVNGIRWDSKGRLEYLRG